MRHRCNHDHPRPIERIIFYIVCIGLAGLFIWDISNKDQPSDHWEDAVQK